MKVRQSLVSARVRAAALLAMLSAPLLSHAAGETGPMADIFAAVTFDGVSAFVGVAGVAIVGIALAYKGISLAKRAVSKA